MSSPASTLFGTWVGKVGPNTVADGSPVQERMEKSGAQCTVDAHGRYQEAVYRGNVFIAATQAAVTFSVGLTTTTCVGFILSNPPNSGKNLVPLQIEFSNTGVIVGTAGIVAFPFSSTAIPHTTALTPVNALIGGPVNCVGKADSGSTGTGTPVLVKPLFSVLSVNTAVGGAACLYDLGGSMIVAPGAAIGVLATAAITGFVGCTWEEISI